MTTSPSESRSFGCEECQRFLAEEVTGLLGPARFEAVRAHLATCAACREVRRGVKAELMPLFDLAASRLSSRLIQPGPDAGALSNERKASLWDRVEQQLSDESEEHDATLAKALATALPDGAHYSPRLKGPWRETGVPGVRAKVLHLDEAADRRVVLVQMDPGGTYPAHQHHRDEECFVIRGDLAVGNHVLRAGDYSRMEAGTLHEDQTTSDGCLVLMIGSCQDAA